MRHLVLLSASLLLGSGVSAVEPVRVITPRQALSLTADDLSTNDVRSVRGIVTFVSGIELNRYVIAPEDHSSWKGLLVQGSADAIRPRLGDLVQVRGRIATMGQGLCLTAERLDLVRSEDLFTPSVAKQADFRRGLLTGRRIALIGTVLEVRHEPLGHGMVSVVKLHLDSYTVIVRVPGVLDPDRLQGVRIQATGLACSRMSEQGAFLDAWLDVAGAEDLVSLEDGSRVRLLLLTSIGLGVVLVLVSVQALVLWLRGRRGRRELEVISAERRRMAADLHDTIEQHLAAANLIAAGVSQLEDAPEDVTEAMRTLSSLLANAKLEVRRSVLNLRSAGDTPKTLAETIGEMSQALAKTGVETRKLLRGLPETMPEGVCQDIVLILREATTNALKHGKARQIVFTADPLGTGGYRLRVLNDGAPFAVDRALGPETGHYGLSGMKERALRNQLAISWGQDGKWTYVELVSEGSR